MFLESKNAFLCCFEINFHQIFCFVVRIQIIETAHKLDSESVKSDFRVKNAFLCCFEINFPQIFCFVVRIQNIETAPKLDSERVKIVFRVKKRIFMLFWDKFSSNFLFCGSDSEHRNCTQSRFWEPKKSFSSQETHFYAVMRSIFIKFFHLWFGFRTLKLHPNSILRA